jgi:hypothetical protein
MAMNAFLLAIMATWLLLRDDQGAPLPMLAFYTPNIASTIISPSSFHKGRPHDQFDGWTLETFPTLGTFRFCARHKQSHARNLTVCGTLDGGLCYYTNPLILPNPDALSDTDPQTVPLAERVLNKLLRELHLDVHVLRADTEHLLWHQRLVGQPSNHHSYHAHQPVDGTPQFKLTHLSLINEPLVSPQNFKNSPRVNWILMAPNFLFKVFRSISVLSFKIRKINVGQPNMQASMAKLVTS